MKCPFCAEEIMDSAAKCKHCGEWIDAGAKPAEKPATTDEQIIFGLPRQTFGVALLLIVAIAVVMLAGEDLEQSITEFFRAPIGFK